MLSCSCDGDYDWYVEEYKDLGFHPYSGKRRTRCQSCKELINIGALCLCFHQWRNPRCDYEERRFGCEVPLADLFLCERCGEIWSNLNATGMCVTFGDMREALQEYWDMTGFDPEKYVEKARAEKAETERDAARLVANHYTCAASVRNQDVS